MDIQMASIVLQDAARYMALASGHEYAKPGAENWCLRIALTRLNEACGHLDLSLMPRAEEAKAAQTPGACAYCHASALIAEQEDAEYNRYAAEPRDHVEAFNYYQEARS